MRTAAYVIGILLLVPMIIFVPGCIELEAWSLLGIMVASAGCLAASILRGQPMFMLPHYLIAAVFLFMVVFPSRLFVFHGPDQYLYRYYSDRKFTRLKNDVLSSSNADSSLTALIEIASTSRNRSTRLLATAALGELGAKLNSTPERPQLRVSYQNAAVPFLAEALDDDDGFVRRQAASALMQSGSLASPAQGALAKRLAKCDDTAVFSAHALGQIQNLSAGSISVLIDCLSTCCDSTRPAVVRALGRVGAKPGVIEALRMAQKDPHQNVALWATAALNDLGYE